MGIKWMGSDAINVIKTEISVTMEDLIWEGF
jgi:hypothetical protein